jgi:hypothetical protein
MAHDRTVMRSRAVLAAVLALGALLPAACGVVAWPAPAPVPPSVVAPPVVVPPVPTSVAPRVAPQPSPSRARAAVDATASAAEERNRTTLGVAVLDLATGQTVTNDEGDTRLRAASVAKLFTVVDILTRRATGAVTTNAGDDRRIQRALSASDDEAMNGLWSTYGGPAGVARVSTLLGLRETGPPDDESQWGEVKTSARDVATLYGFVAQRLAPADRDLVLDALAAAPPTAADGFDQAFGLLDPSRRGGAAAKQGWLCCLQSSIDLHSAGLPDPAGRYVLVLMSNQPLGYAAARTVLDDAASAARDALGRT